MSETASASPRSAVPSITDSLLWLGWIGLAAGVGALAFVIQAKFAPLVVFSILWGVVLGLSAHWLRTQTTLPAWLRAVAIVLGVVLSVATFHWCAYQQRLAFLDEQTERSVQDTGQAWVSAVIQQDRPADVVDFLHREATRGRGIVFGPWRWQLTGTAAWVLWGIEAAIVLVVALVVAFWRRLL
jgi:hypothetical protein